MPNPKRENRKGKRGSAYYRTPGEGSYNIVFCVPKIDSHCFQIQLSAGSCWALVDYRPYGWNKSYHDRQGIKNAGIPGIKYNT